MRVFLFFCCLYAGFAFGQNPTIKRPNRNSADYKNYFGRYSFYKNIYNDRNDVIIPIDIIVWQKDNGTGNYIDTAINREVLKSAISDMNRFYTSIVAPTTVFPWVKNYTTTKIHFVLMNLFFEKRTDCWKRGKYSSYQEGAYLNKIANQLHPEDKHYFKIHIVSDSSRNGGFGTFPTFDYLGKREQFIVTSNSGFSIYKNKDDAWPLAMHFAHEMAHNLDLYHTYSAGFDACNQSNPDYLDDVFGRGNNAVCPQQAGWNCEASDPSNSCSNNIVGGTKDSRYISPKQVQRMHRALALKSIGKYAIPYHFNKNKVITIDTSRLWDFNLKLFTNLRLAKNDTLIVKNTIRFVPQAKLIMEPGSVLIVDGGLLTVSSFFEDAQWKGIEIHGKNSSQRIIIKNGGRIEKVASP